MLPQKFHSNSTDNHVIELSITKQLVKRSRNDFKTSKTVKIVLSTPTENSRLCTRIDEKTWFSTRAPKNSTRIRQTIMRPNFLSPKISSNGSELPSKTKKRSFFSCVITLRLRNFLPSLPMGIPCDLAWSFWSHFWPVWRDFWWYHVRIRISLAISSGDLGIAYREPCFFGSTRVAF